MTLAKFTPTETTEEGKLPSKTPEEIAALNAMLLHEQPAALEAAIAWLSEPADSNNIDSCVSVITGFAGTGKSFVTNTLIENAIARLGFDRANIIGVAPTHAAAKNLGTFANIEARTIHSFLGLRMQAVKLNKDMRRELESLLATSSSLEFSPTDTARLALLEHLEQCEQERKKELRPNLSKADFAELCAAELIIIDEGYMLDKQLVSLVHELLVKNLDLPRQPKVLIFGDPAQLAPINELLSGVSEFNHIAHLSTVVRQDGIQLDYVTDLRNCEDDAELGYLHQQYLAENDPSFTRLSQPLIQEHFRSQVEAVGLENIRVLTTSNERVRELNDLLYRCTYPYLEYERPYASGHLLLTMGPVMRDPNFPDTPGANEGDILFPTSTPVRVEKALTPLEVYSAAGTGYLVSTLFVSAGRAEHEIVAMHPLEIAQWEEEKNLFYKMAASTTGRSKKKGARGQEGEYAKRAWEVFGLKNWNETIDEFDSKEEEVRVQKIWRRWSISRTRNRIDLGLGQKLSAQDFGCVRGQLWGEYHGLRQLADNLSLSFSSTTHKAQGSTIKLVILDFPKFLPRSNGYVKPGSTWDNQKTLYTAASRVGGEDSQLIFMY